MKKLRIIFAGTPEFARQHLQAIMESHHELVAVYTQPDRRCGRGQKYQSSPVKDLAQQKGISLEQPATLKTAEAQKVFANFNADLMVVVAYGLLLPQAILTTPRYGCINVHGSILPKWRGAAPIQRAIEAGDIMTGITIMQMDEGLDTGAMLLKSSCPINETDNSAHVHDRLIEIGKPLLINALAAIANNSINSEQQNSNHAPYAHKISKQEAQIDFNASAKQLDRKISAFNPWPIVTAKIESIIVRLWESESITSNTSLKPPGTIMKTSKEGIDVSCGEGVLRIKVLQLPGSVAVKAHALLNSKKHVFCVGNCFK